MIIIIKHRITIPRLLGTAPTEFCHFASFKADYQVHLCWVKHYPPIYHLARWCYTKTGFTSKPVNAFAGLSSYPNFYIKGWGTA